MVLTEEIRYENLSRYECIDYIKSRCYNITKSVRFIEIKKGHLKIKCPFTENYILIEGSQEDLEWINQELFRQRLYINS